MVSSDGYFAPDSMAWRLHADPTALLGGMRALLMQALEPRAMAGVSAFSSFRDDPWARLARTSQFVVTMTYGTREEADGAVAVVREIHSRVRGVAAETGQSFSADDPELLLYVHTTLVHSIVTGYRRFAGPLDDHAADQYVAEMTPFATLLGVPEPGVPQSMRELRDYFTTMRPNLRITDGAREGLGVILAPPMPLPLRPLWLLPALGAVSLLPGWARSMYGIPWVPPATTAVRAALFPLTRALNIVRPEPPALRAARARVA